MYMYKGNIASVDIVRGSFSLTLLGSVLMALLGYCKGDISRGSFPMILL
jgi:hypothetical protein